MFQFAGDAAGVENAVRAFGPLQIELDHAQASAEHEIVRRRVSMHEHLLILPHPRLIPSLVAQPVQLACFVPADRADFAQRVFVFNGSILFFQPRPRTRQTSPAIMRSSSV